MSNEKAFLMTAERLLPLEFKSIIYAKGWKLKEVASRWGIGSVRMSQICNDDRRPHYYDDAVRGLPHYPHQEPECN